MTDKERDLKSYDQLAKLGQILQKHYEDELRGLGSVVPAIRVIQEAQKAIMEEEKTLDTYRYDSNGTRI